MRGAVDTRVPVRILACEQGRPVRPLPARAPAALNLSFAGGGVSRGIYFLRIANKNSDSDVCTKKRAHLFDVLAF